MFTRIIIHQFIPKVKGKLATEKTEKESRELRVEKGAVASSSYHTE